MTDILILIISCLLLTWSADRFLVGMTGIAVRFKWPAVVVGTLLLGLGTSFPEMVAAGVAGWHGKTALAVGNAIGSNIVNIGLVAGLTALISPLLIRMRWLRVELPLLMFLVCVVAGLLWDHQLSRVDGLILLALFFAYVAFLLFSAKKDQEWSAALSEESELEFERAKGRFSTHILFGLLGLAGLFLSSEWIVGSATEIARRLGVSDLTIGLTVVAVGTSLPELATSLMCLFRRQTEMAVGNIIGSCIFNLLAVLAMPALFAPGQLSHNVLYRDFPAMFGFILGFWLLIWLPPKGRLGRFPGCILLLSYVGYFFFVY